MKQEQFKKLYRRIRKIENSQMIGTYGHMIDLVNEFKVTLDFIYAVRPIKHVKLINGKYTKEYRDNANQQAAIDNYYENMIGA